MAQSPPSNTASAQPSQDLTPPFLKENFKAIRLMVYDNMEGLPENNTDRVDRDRVGDFEKGEYEEWKKFMVTRESLRLVCKQVKEEWTPAFLRSTTICLNWHRTPRLFETVFLRYFNDWEVKSIWRLAYNGSLYTSPYGMY